MAKCEPGCSCGRHSRKSRPTCAPDCTCKRHVPFTPERKSAISAGRTGVRLSEEVKGGMRCPVGCECAKHDLRNSGQFGAHRPGGFHGRHSDETKSKLASYTGERASNFKHGLSGTITYTTWSAMRSRCSDPRNASYPQYGARGISVCERWSDFLNFLADMGERPSLDYSIDRIDGSRNYEPGNCRWATREEQNANRSDPGGWNRRRSS